jgi:hypothetical protein
MFRIFYLSTLLLFLNNCALTGTTFLGPTITTVKTGSISHGGLSYGSNTIMKKIHKNIKKDKDNKNVVCQAGVITHGGLSYGSNTNLKKTHKDIKKNKDNRTLACQASINLQKNSKIDYKTKNVYDEASIFFETVKENLSKF